MEDGILSSLADDEVGPLDHHNGDEEGGVTGVLQDLPVPDHQHSIRKCDGSLQGSSMRARAPDCDAAVPGLKPTPFQPMVNSVISSASGALRG